MEFITKNPTAARIADIKGERREAARADRLAEQHDMNVAQTHRGNRIQDEDRSIAAEDRTRSHRIQDADIQRRVADRLRAHGIEDARLGREASDWIFNRNQTLRGNKIQDGQIDRAIADWNRSRQHQDEDRSQAAAIDAAQRGIASQSGGNAATMAAVPGAGKLAMGLAQSEAKAQEDAERLAIQALAAGDMVTFQHWQQKSGLKVPPAALQSAEAGQLFGRAMTAAEAMYRDDPAQAQQFVRSYMQTKGNLEQSIQAAGVPRTKPNWSLQTVLNKGQRSLMLIDTVSGQAKPVTDQSGAPVMADHASGSNKPSSQENQISFLTRMGMSPDQAVELVYSSKGNAAALEGKLYTAVLSSLLDQLSPPPLAQAQAQAAQAVEQFRATMGSQVQAQGLTMPQQQAPQQTQGGFGATGMAPASLPQQQGLPPVSIPQLQSPMGGEQVLGAVQGLPPDARLFRTDPDGTQWFESQSAGGYIEVPAGAGSGSL